MKGVARKRDKINKQALEDVSLLLKTAKEITFDKSKIESEENLDKVLPKSNNILENLGNHSNSMHMSPSKSLKNAVSKFKSKTSRNKVIPETNGIELINTNKIEEKSENKELLANNNELLSENTARKEEEIRESEENNNQNSSDSSSSESNHSDTKHNDQGVEILDD